MLVSIYHMIRDGRDFQPADYEQVVTRRQKSNELNLDQVIAFLGEQGVDGEVIRQVESQCSKEQPSEGEGSQKDMPEKTKAKKKQPESNTVAKTAKRGGSRKSSRTKKESPSTQPEAATA